MSEAIELLLEGKPRDLGHFVVARVLPDARRRMVGPFIFFDHFGPVVLGGDRRMDVRPHPHIGLATVTYLFDGEVVHRDSLGSDIAIHPGDINWMTAGRGISHSERTREPTPSGLRLHGLQLWVALPDDAEEAEPAFVHYPKAGFPLVQRDGIVARVLIGRAWEAVSPVKTYSPTWYVDVSLGEGAQLPVPAEVLERAVYVVEGHVQLGAVRLGARQMAVLAPGTEPVLHVEGPTRLVLVGGDPVGHRHIWWNFVSSRKERIEQAKAEWREERFPAVPGETERIPLPDP